MVKPTLYVDTSAAMKAVFEEAESTQIRELWALAAANRVDLVASEWLMVELLCASRTRDGADAPAVTTARAVVQGVNLIEFDRTILTHAMSLPYLLRAGDALHLATALRHGLRRMVVFDERLAAAATQAGIRIVRSAADLDPA